ncbi:thiopeptide-type bacteriocin biosynthesis protein [uncultured Tenacibaculum sp.]|uniref:thiopeptide-type bacteriocin biosynthesis protein n=1 Tax=uncultured Tenacibaculum sp. TaxID=174713 RepID=UPI002623EA98|nr:thiopeptide-type bacteriocin biosynthesis protein [uncultured Tenacibaculum sp.]
MKNKKDNNTVKRNFFLGDNWIYYKIYSGYKTSDKILLDIVEPVVTELVNKNLIDKWFFIRYSDPENHLRLRFHFENKVNLLSIIDIMHIHFNDFIEKKLIWKIQTDTYKREIERYGVNSISISEDIFYYNSVMVIRFLGFNREIEDNDVRWLFSLKSIDSLLNSFNYSLKDKVDLLLKLSTSFKQEFNSSKFLIKQLSKKYRDKQNKINLFLSEEFKNESYSSTIINIISKHDNDIKDLVYKINIINDSGNLDIDLNDLMSSYIHMLMNRLFTSKNRLHEMVCYEFLYRYYKSKHAQLQN